MSGERVPVLLTVLSGRFASQPLAFAALQDAAAALGIEFDLAEVDVIRAAANVRLAPELPRKVEVAHAGITLDDLTRRRPGQRTSKFAQLLRATAEPDSHR